MEANQTVRLDLGTPSGVKSMRMGFTDQRLTAHGGLAVWTRFITERGLRGPLRAVRPHAPTPVLTDPAGKRVLEVVAGRPQEAAEGLPANALQPAQRAAVEAVRIDLRPAFAAAVSARLPRARIVHDPFHVGSHANASD